MPPMTAPLASAAHFQLFAQDGKSAICWRLLSGNNRELGRGALSHADLESCLLAIKQLLESLDELCPDIRRKEGHLWQWSLLADDDVVVTSSHAYDRRIRCMQAMEHFRLQVKDARQGDTVMFTGARRWMHAAAGRRPLQTGSRSDASMFETGPPR
jgi:hypothetical protein